MKKLYKFVEPDAEAYFFRGVEGFKNYLQLILEQKQTVYFIGDYVVTFVGVKPGELYEEPLQFVLKSRLLADGYRKFFQFIWDHCNEH